MRLTTDGFECRRRPTLVASGVGTTTVSPCSAVPHPTAPLSSTSCQRRGVQNSLAGSLQSSEWAKDDSDLSGTGVRGVSNPLSQRIEAVRTRESASCLEIEARMPSDVKAISPLVDRLIRLIEESRCVVGEELAVELAIREALTVLIRASWFKCIADVNGGKSCLWS